MTIKVLVNGAFGKMGQMITRAIVDDARFALVGQTGREYDLKTAIQDSQAEVVIDFTHPHAVFNNTKTIISAGARPVIGTTGLKQKQIKELAETCAAKKRGCIIAPNFSLGAILLMRYAKEIAKYFPKVEIIEFHHEDKADSPSGTAIRTAELLSQTKADIKKSIKVEHENIPGARGAKYQDIPIHSIRLPGLLAHQEIIFGSRGETLSLRHDTIDRQCFLPGICLACEKVMKLEKLVYGLEEILE